MGPARIASGAESCVRDTYVYIHIYMCHIGIHTNTYTHTHNAHTHTNTHTHTHTHTRTLSHTHRATWDWYALKHARLFVSEIRVCIYIYTCVIYVYIQTHI